MSVQKSGLKYLTTYSGILNTVELALNVVTFISVSICGYILKTYLLIFVSIYAFLSTGIFILMHIKSLFRKFDIPWYWIECVHCLVTVIIYTLASSVVLSELTKVYIVTGVIGYITAMVYVLDTIDKFKLAITPRARYVWTTPNMPEL